MRQTLFYIFAPLALAGLVLSIATHISALMGRTGPLGDSAMFLHAGVFIVWIPAVFVAKSLTRRSNAIDFWKAALRGAPPWVRYTNHVLFAYAFVNFFITWSKNDPHGSAETLRMFSGHWILFYAVALSTLYSGSNIAELDRKCPNGHPVDPLSPSCQTCGAGLPVQ